MTIAAHALELHRRGWCPIPLPAAAKWPPPEGRTGAAGIDYTADQIAAWDDSGNVGTRMPVGVIGIDIDQYGGKQGWDNLEQFREHRGLDPLPATHMITSRDHPSGIRFYQIPQGLRLAGEACPDVEIIQRHHRYAVVTPTLHPDTGHPYLWIDTASGETSDTPPWVDDLADLPTAWVDALRDRSAAVVERPAATWDNPDAHSADWAPKVRAAHHRYAEGGGSRHDNAMKAVCALTRLDSFGLAGARNAIDDIGRRFVNAVTTDNSRDQAAAEAEWGRIVNGANARVATTTPRDPMSVFPDDQPAAQPDDPWPDPVPLAPPPPHPFPTHVLPAWAADMVDDVARTVQCPTDIPGQSVLGALAVVAVGKVWVDVTNDWSEPVALYLATAVPPSGGKSPAMNACFDPVRDLEEELRDEARQVIAEAEAQRKILERQLRDAEKNGDIQTLAAAALALDTPGPVRPRLITDDQTPEAFVALLDAHRRISIVSTEGGLFSMMERYTDGKAAQLDPYLKTFSGDDITVDRKGEPEPRIIRKPLATICLTVQPRVLAELGQRRDMRGRGLPQRFMYSWPDSNVGERDLATHREADPVIRAAWRDNIMRIGRLLATSQHPYRVRLSPQAWNQFGAWRDRIERRRGCAGDLEHLAEWTAKAEQAVLRTAGLLWLADGAEGRSIDAPTIARAITLGDYWLSHAERVYDAWAVDEDLDNAKDVLRICHAKRWSDVSVRVLMRHNSRRWHDAETTQRAIRVLLARGWVRPVAGVDGTWQVRPNPETGPNTQLSTESVAHVARFAKYSKLKTPPSTENSAEATPEKRATRATGPTARPDPPATTQREDDHVGWCTNTEARP